MQFRKDEPKSTTNSAAGTHLNSSSAMACPHVVDAAAAKVLVCLGFMIRRYPSDQDERHGYNERNCHNLDHGLPPSICT